MPTRASWCFQRLRPQQMGCGTSRDSCACSRSSNHDDPVRQHRLALDHRAWQFSGLPRYASQWLSAFVLTSSDRGPQRPAFFALFGSRKKADRPLFRPTWIRSKLHAKDPRTVGGVRPTESQLEARQWKGTREHSPTD
jgi:hypothetical protein